MGGDCDNLHRGIIMLSRLDCDVPAKPSFDMASENALVLQDCTYANLDLGRTVKNLWDVTKVLEMRWEKHDSSGEGS